MSKELNPVEIQFRSGQPWRTLLNLYWPERCWVGLALLSYLFKASPVWILPVITANIIDIIAHHREGGVHGLWLNAAVGAVATARRIQKSENQLDPRERRYLSKSHPADAFGSGLAHGAFSDIS
jgi:hypothetical protein